MKDNTSEGHLQNGSDKTKENVIELMTQLSSRKKPRADAPVVSVEVSTNEEDYVGREE